MRVFSEYEAFGSLKPVFRKFSTVLINKNNDNNNLRSLL